VSTTVAATTTRVDERVDVSCSRCDLTYELGVGQARKVATDQAPGVCPCCRYRERHPPDEDDRAWWLRRFTDAEIAEMGRALFGVGSVETVSQWRARLIGVANGRASPRRRGRPRLGRPRRNPSREQAYRALWRRSHDVPNRPRLARLGRCGEDLPVRRGRSSNPPPAAPLPGYHGEANRRAGRPRLPKVQRAPSSGGSEAFKEPRLRSSHPGLR
jgi:hypothetical protein